jgi:hypothetical protein
VLLQATESTTNPQVQLTVPQYLGTTGVTIQLLRAEGGGGGVTQIFEAGQADFNPRDLVSPSDPSCVFAFNASIVQVLGRYQGALKALFFF